MVGRRSFPFGFRYMFRGELLNFRSVIVIYAPLKFYMVHLSNEKNPGWLFDIGDYTTQLYRDCNKPL